MDEILKLEALVATAKAEGEKFFVKGVKASGTRCRLALQEVKKQSQVIRELISETKNAE